MQKLPKSIIAKYGITKKAWEVFRGSKSGGKKKASGSKKKHRAAAKQSTKGTGMAKRAKRVKRRVKHAARRAGRKIGVALDTKPGKILKMAGVAAAGGVVTSYGVNHIPKVKDFSATNKALLQGAIGLGLVFLGKKKILKGLGAGAVLASVFGLSKEVLKLNPLAGPGSGVATLSPEQIRRLTNGSMNLPLSNVRMNIPANVTMRGAYSPITGSRSSGWGNR